MISLRLIKYIKFAYTDPMSIFISNLLIMKKMTYYVMQIEMNYLTIRYIIKASNRPVGAPEHVISDSLL